MNTDNSLTNVQTKELDEQLRRENYVPYGKQWEKEMMRFTKKQLIENIKRLLI